MNQNNQYTNRILLVTTGLSPQIVTETLYKLAVDNEQPFIPTEVHLITTQDGAAKARQSLLAGEQGENRFGRFCEDYGLSGIKFEAEHIHIIADTEGVFIDDSHCTEHNRASADFITQKVREFTRDEDSALHVSLAGGRKTMSFYTGYALSLYGRAQDRLSHVLVNDEYQNKADFYYPLPGQTGVTIILSEIPYVRMRYQVPDQLLEGKVGFQDAVNTIQRFMLPETIVCYEGRKTIELNGLAIKLSDADFAFYLWMCRRKKHNEAPLGLEEDVFMDDYLAIYKMIVKPESPYIEKVEKIFKHGDIRAQKKWFGQRKGSVHEVIEKKLGKKLAEPFLIKTNEKNGKATYEIGLPVSRIEIKR